MSTAVLPRRGFLPSFPSGKFSLAKPGNFLKRYGLFSLLLLTLFTVTMASSDTNFDGIYIFISIRIELFAVVAFIMGIDFVRQSVMAIVIGSGVGLVMFYDPNIIDGIVTAAI